MNSLPSSQFKAQYHRLTEPTTVTVNGHPIGTWTPLFNEPEDFQARFPEAIPIETPRVATEPNTLKESPQDIAQRARRERQKRIDAVLRGVAK